MNLEQLTAQFRSDADDTVANPYLFSDEDIAGWLTEAEEEAALRGRLLFEDADATVCTIAVTAGAPSYVLHECVTEITRAWFTPTAGVKTVLELVDRVELDRIRPDWRDTTEDPRYLVQDDTRVRLGCIPASDGLLRIECYRLPLAPLANDNDAPEIHRAHHAKLVNWALHRAYGRPNTETHDANRSAMAEAEFTRVFGPRPDSDMRRSTQSNTPQFNKAW